MQNYSRDLTMDEAEDDSTRIAGRLKGLAYARAIGVATGIFLLIWLPFNSLRWGNEAPAGLLGAEWVLFGLIGIFLMLPWRRLEKRKAWKYLLISFSLTAAAFTFMLVVDLIFQYMMAAEQGTKPAPPAFQSLLLFIVLMQPAVVLFQKSPELLD